MKKFILMIIFILAFVEVIIGDDVYNGDTAYYYAALIDSCCSQSVNSCCMQPNTNSTIITFMDEHDLQNQYEKIRAIRDTIWADTIEGNFGIGDTSSNYRYDIGLTHSYYDEYEGRHRRLTLKNLENEKTETRYSPPIVRCRVNVSSSIIFPTQIIADPEYSMVYVWEMPREPSILSSGVTKDNFTDYYIAKKEYDSLFIEWENKLKKMIKTKTMPGKALITWEWKTI